LLCDKAPGITPHIVTDLHPKQLSLNFDLK
jgi:hypothetical protein